jgi:predicted ATPase
VTSDLSRQHASPLRVQATGFVGRTAELARVSALLDDARLVTLTGTGGVGKTRLAMRAATEAAGRYPDGVHLVELSPLRDPALLAHTVASRLGLPGDDGRPPTAAVLDHLRDRELLLILDTCEHLLDACAEFADVVLRGAHGVTILATSRQPLDAAGECTFLVRPLTVPDADDQAQDAAAVELFAQRAAAIVDGFTITENRADVIGICRALDGLPLAIELATVRLRALPLDQMARGREDRFHALTGGKRAGPPRHQTLRAAIQWSYELCTRPEQVLWARLSVFAGSFDIATVEDVCAGGELSREEIIEELVALVEKSVLVRDATPDSASYRMLGTLREFGAERLAGTSAEDCLRNRFVAHYLAMAQRFGRDPMSEQLSQYHALRRDHANLRAAFEYALDLPGNASAAISIATSLMLYWRLSGRLREGEYWLNRVLERCPAPSAVRARVLGVRAYVTMLLGDIAAARGDAEAAVEMAAAFGDMAARGRGCVVLHRALTWTGNLAEATEQADVAVACLASVADTFSLASLDIQAAMLHLHSGEPARVIELCAKGISRLPADEHWATGYLLGLQCAAHLMRGEFGPSGVAGRLGLTMKYELGDISGIAYLLGINAFLAAGQHRYQRAAWLFGASAPLWERAGRWYTDAPVLVALHQVAERLARSGLGEDRYWDVHARGRATPLDRVIKLALANADKLPDTAVELENVPPLGFSY